MSDRTLPVLPPLPEDRDPTAERVVDPLPPAAGEPAPTDPPPPGAGEPAPTNPPQRRSERQRPPRPSRPRPTRGPRRPRPDEERRLWSAGHALIVVTLALVVGLLFNAPGAHKKAYNMEAGWQREVTLALTGPLASISHALLLDRPRAAVQAAIGRSGEDEIDTEIAIGVDSTAPEQPGAAQGASDETAAAAGGGTTAGGGADASATAKPKPAPTTPGKVAFTPKKQLRVWVAGDSLVITPGYAILRATGASPVMNGLAVDGRVATGLTRPDVFNWFAEVKSQVEALKPNVVVLAFGGNDDKAYMTGLPDGVSIADFGDAAWQREYRRRVGGVFDVINKAGAHAIWIGLPQTSSPDQTQRFDVVNAAVAAEARERPDTVTYLDTYAMFAGPDGGYAEYLDRPGGGSVKVRAGDGVHFERAGGDMIAREVLKTLNKTYDLTSWRKQKAAAS